MDMNFYLNILFQAFRITAVVVFVFLIPRILLRWKYLLRRGGLYACLLSLFWMFNPESDNPFRRNNTWDKQPLVQDESKRKKVLKQRFKKNVIPNGLDAIVIGSGIGGLTVAAILSRANKRVLVLEQDYQAGGCCHTFIDKGYEFEIGTHYVGGMGDSNPSVSKVLLDQISEGKIDWEELDENYDRVYIASSTGKKTFDIHSKSDKFVKSLTNDFPAEEEAIKKYFKMVQDACKGEAVFKYIKLFPQWFVSFLINTGLIYLTKFFQMSKKTLQDVLDEITNDKNLQTVLAYNFGCYGNLPNDTSFVMHAMLVNHFLNGGFYPKGGGSEIPLHIIPVIERSGGRVLVGATVTRILLNSDNTHVTGVVVKCGDESVEINAPLVISNAGILNTYSHLLSPEVTTKYGLGMNLERVKSGIATLHLFVGLQGNSKELNVKARRNIWAFKDNDFNTIQSYVSGTSEEAVKEGIPSLFISFDSTKDPTWEKRFPGKTTCAVIALAPYKWFESWEGMKKKQRGDDYFNLKTALGYKIWEQVVDMFPQLKDKDNYFEIGTPLTNKDFLSSPKGEIYGCNHNKERFSPITTAMLRAETPVPGLYLTGQDISTCGFSGAMQGGLMTSMVLLKRDLHRDLMDICEILKTED